MAEVDEPVVDEALANEPLANQVVTDEAVQRCVADVPLQPRQNDPVVDDENSMSTINSSENFID